eukprot:scaffold191922_cov31-Tisochrysis_lutea.AAC.1
MSPSPLVESLGDPHYSSALEAQTERTFRVYECDQVPRGALPDATAREADALFGEVLHCRLDGIDL